MAELTRIRTRAEDALAKHFSAIPHDDPNYDARATAFAAVGDHGLPHRRVEDWKYTDLRALMRDAPPPAVAVDLAAARAALDRADLFAGIDRARLVFVNGQFVPSLSEMAGLQDAVEFASFGGLLADDGATLDRSSYSVETPIFALNTAFVTDGAVLRIRDGAKPARPVEIVTVFAGEAAGLQTLRHRLAVGARAEATILQTFAGPDGVAYQTNSVTEIGVGDGASLRFVTAQEEGRDALHLAVVLPRIGARARFDPFSFLAGGRVARTELRMTFDGEASSAGVRGATIGTARQHLDTTLLVDHAVPDCRSQEYFKAALDGESQGVFQGKIIVQPDAQKTEAKMMSRALLLSDSAEFANKPELEIFADDVVCGHGATCGQIDEDMLFFLRSRGIERREAERMLIQAFLAEVIEQIGDQAIVEALETRTSRWLGMAADIRG